MGAIGQRLHLVDDPRQTSLFHEARTDDSVGIDEIAHVVDGVLELAFGERAARPVGQRLAFRQSDATERVDKPVVRNLRALPQKRSGNLGVEYGGRQHAQAVEQDLHVLRAGMKHLEHARVGHELGERREVLDGKRVDDRALIRGRHLD